MVSPIQLILEPNIENNFLGWFVFGFSGSNHRLLFEDLQKRFLGAVGVVKVTDEVSPSESTS
jgi:hypothetical protein